MISIQKATRSYGSVVAVKDVTVDIQRGEVVGLLGHNGAGKTTLMKMLTGVLEPSDGAITVAGHDLVHARTEAQRHIGYLPESAPLYPEMAVVDYLLMMAELRGIPRIDQDRAVLEAAASTGLTERLHQPIRELSKGFRQRVGLAQAIVHDPAVLVLDEPTNGLDPVQIESIRSLIGELAKKTTILLSTHILHEVEAVCDRVVILIGGKMVADSRLDDLLRSDRVLLSLREANVVDVIRSRPDFDEVEVIGADATVPGATRYAVRGEDAVSALLELARRKGWTVQAVGPEVRTLETVFKELQAAHAQGET